MAAVLSRGSARVDKVYFMAALHSDVFQYKMTFRILWWAANFFSPSAFLLSRQALMMHSQGTLHTEDT